MPTLSAPAKLTLSLRITGRRADGYHLIDAEMVTLDLADRVHIEEGGQGLVLRGLGADELTAQHDRDPRANLVVRALALTGRRARITVDKRIAAGAGLGGGSADAAAVLRWAGFSDLDRAAGLGADVAFCLVGGRARVGGIGELVEPLEFTSRTFTVWTPPFGCDTEAVYRAWDDLGGPTGPGPNDLEPAALVVQPALAHWRDRLAEVSGQVPVLAGSGSSWFVEGAFPGEGRIVCRTVPPAGAP